MPLIGKAIKVAASPSHEQHELCIQGSGDSPNSLERNALDPATFDEGHDALRQPGAHGDVALSPAESMAEHPKTPTDLSIVHSAIVAAIAYFSTTNDTSSWYARAASRTDVADPGAT